MRARWRGGRRRGFGRFASLDRLLLQHFATFPATTFPPSPATGILFSVQVISDDGSSVNAFRVECAGKISTYDAEQIAHCRPAAFAPTVAKTTNAPAEAVHDPASMPGVKPPTLLKPLISLLTLHAPPIPSRYWLPLRCFRPSILPSISYGFASLFSHRRLLDFGFSETRLRR